MNAHIRPLLPVDAPAYKALRDDALRRDPSAFTSDYAAALPQPASHYAPRFGDPATGQFFLGAFDASGALIGCVGCERAQRAKERHCATVVGMMVAPGAQRQGLGRQLLAACAAAAARAPGLQQLVLSVTAGNAHAQRLYEQAGFRVWGRHTRAIVVDGVGYDKLHMLLDLPFSPAASA